jgi:thiamine pyrophosphate-dependent acetolactate synthase large subunit-like protein
MKQWRRWRRKRKQNLKKKKKNKREKEKNKKKKPIDIFCSIGRWLGDEGDIMSSNEQGQVGI